MLDPRQAFLADRVIARSGETVYDGDRFPIVFKQPVQDAVDELAKHWKVPRAYMIRWLVDYAIDNLDHGGG